jgi:hypothetical protein
VDYAEFTRHVNKAGLQLKEFAALLDVYPPSISRYAGRQVPAKYAVLAILLGDVIDRKAVDVPELLARNGFTWPRSVPVARLDEYRARKRAMPSSKEPA